MERYTHACAGNRHAGSPHVRSRRRLHRAPKLTATPNRPPSTPSVPVPNGARGEGDRSHGAVRFAWDYSGQLQSGQAFEVRIWAEGQEHLGVAQVMTTGN